MSHMTRNPIGYRSRGTMGYGSRISSNYGPGNFMRHGPRNPIGYGHYARAILETGTPALVSVRRADIDYNDTSNYNYLFLCVHNGELQAAVSLLDGEAHLIHIESYGRTLIHVAAARGHEQIVRLLCQRNADITKGDKDGNTPLHLALKGNHSAVAKSLINRDTTNLKNCHMETPLHIATEKDDSYLMKVLLENGARVNEQDDEGRTPLYVAVKKRNPKIEIVMLFLTHGASAKSSCDKGFTPLHHAVASKNEEIVDVLINHKASINRNDGEGVTPHSLAIEKNDTAQYGNEEISKLVLTNRSDILNVTDKYLKTPLHIAAAKGHTKVLKYLIESGAKIGALTLDGETPLHLSVVHNHLDVFKCLIDHGAKVNTVVLKDGETMLHLAAANGSLEILKHLIKGGAKVDAITKKGETPLHFSVTAGHLDIVKELLDRGANIESKTHDRNTALCLAVRARKREIVSFLLTKNASLRTSDELFIAAIEKNWRVMRPIDFADSTPLHIAAKSGDEEILKLLLKSDFNFMCVDLQIKDKKTPLHLAAIYGHQKSVKVLLESGAYIDARTRYGETPLHLAAASGRSSTVEFLLKAGAKVDCQTKNNYTPLLYALDRGRHNAILNKRVSAHSPEGITSFLQPHDIFSTNIVSLYRFQEYLKITEMLLIKGDSPTTLIPCFGKGGRTPFTLASQMRVFEEDQLDTLHRTEIKGEFRPEIVRCLLSYCNEEDLLEIISDSRILIWCMCPELMDILLEYDINGLFRDVTLLRGACLRGDRRRIIAVADHMDNVDMIIKSIPKNIVNRSMRWRLGSGPEIREDIANLLLAIIIKIRSTSENNSVLQKEEIEFREAYKLHDWGKKCELEIMRMQETMILDEFNITFYDILTKPISKLVCYVRNDDLLRILESGSCVKFPIYEELLRKRVEKSKERKELIDSSEKFFSNLIRRNHKIELPSLVVYEIFSYLKVTDLHKLINSFSLTNR